MGKRGPKAKAKYASRGATLSARLSDDTLARLKAKAEENEVSVSRQLERLLLQSLDDQQAALDYGGLSTSALLRVFAEAFSRISIQATVIEPKPGSDTDISEIERQAKARKRGWWNDRYIFDECADFLAAFFQRFQPDGERIVPAHLRGYQLGQRWAAMSASQLEMISAGLPAPAHAKLLADILTPKMGDQ